MKQGPFVSGAARLIHYVSSIVLCYLCLGDLAQAERIKDLAGIAGIRDNQLIGYGLVVGLDGTGDRTSQSQFTVQSLKSFLRNFGVNIPPDVDPQTDNVAAVVIHSTLPPFASPGQTIDVTVSSLGNAESLRGGSLLMTPLKGADGRTYAIAQGSLVVSGFGAESDGSSITVNVPSVGRIPNGATVERGVPSPFSSTDRLVLNLHNVDFTTATRMTETINAVAGVGAARPIDGSAVEVNFPADPAQRVAFVSMIENLTLEPGEASAKVIINSRTGTVVIGRHVRVQPAAVSHGNLTVTITSQPLVSQPNPFAAGDTVVVPRSDIEISEEGNRMFLFEPGVTLDEIVRAVNEVGAAPGDLVAIMEALREVGALRAELVVM
ncbi:MAG: flagellar basal body P-ring protein FlgI [Gammaproteobacteria bacterium]|nr:flagellar basal body P-ring protein FlgI [Gammaproteobacteria bacterium]